jgi:hypothetical protein
MENCAACGAVFPTDQFEWFFSTRFDGDFEIIDTTPFIPITIYGANGPVTGSADLSGSVTLTPQVPEPSTIALMLLGVGILFVLRKRNSRGHQLAT